MSPALSCGKTLTQTMSDDDRRPLRADEQLLESNHASLFTVFNRVIRETEHGSCPTELHAELESEVRSNYYKLKKHDDHHAVEETWEESQLDQIPVLCARQYEVETGSKGDFGINKQNTETRIERAPLDYLIQWTLAIDKIIGELGLGAAVKQSIDSNDVSRDDLAALLEHRGQSDALENANVN